MISTRDIWGRGRSLVTSSLSISGSKGGKTKEECSKQQEQVGHRAIPPRIESTPHPRPQDGVIASAASSFDMDLV